MSRGVSAANETAASAAEVRPVLLFNASFYGDGSTEEIFMWNGIGDLTALSSTWAGVGNLIAISPTEETYEIKATGFTVTLNGIASTMLGYALNFEYQNRMLTVYLGFLDSTGALVADPMILMRGRMDVMDISDEGSVASITVNCETRMIDFERPRRSTYTHNDQQKYYPGDYGFVHVQAIQDKEVLWGIEDK